MNCQTSFSRQDNFSQNCCSLHAVFVAHSMAGPQRTCLACFASVHVPLLAADVSLMWWEHLIVLECEHARGGWGWGSGCRLWPDSSPAVGLWTLAPGMLQRQKGAFLSPCSVPRELCQRGQEEKTHSSNTQWVRACTLMSYLQYVCLLTVACEQWRKQYWDL